MGRIKYILKDKLGVDKAIFYTLVGRSLGIPVSVLTIFFIARYLSPEEQGYYYTFGSIVALQVFFELGLTGIITQFVAHEASHLSWNGRVFVGEEGDVHIVNNVKIGVVAVVTKSIHDTCIVVGNPARIIMKHGSATNVTLTF